MPKRKYPFPPGSVCKPCWELRYCPYGYLVEFFPLLGLPVDLADIKRRYEDILKGFEDGRSNEREVDSEIERLLYHRPENWKFALQFDEKEISCNVWGHVCPVFFCQSGATETKEERRMGRDIPREIMLKVVRRDNYTCQRCGKHLLDNEIEFDHIIPVSRGGPTSVENIRILCRPCNRAKSSSSSEFVE
jgi:hypothetical protein